MPLQLADQLREMRRDLPNQIAELDLISAYIEHIITHIDTLSAETVAEIMQGDPNLSALIQRYASTLESYAKAQRKFRAALVRAHIRTKGI